MAKTISFPKGKGSLRHNNRDFISSNVDESRTPMNVYFVQEPLKEAYEKCFGQALSDYNAKQKRKDRIKDDYISEIRNSGNGEKVFYENVVQIGDMHDTGMGMPWFTGIVMKDGSKYPYISNGSGGGYTDDTLTNAYETSGFAKVIDPDEVAAILIYPCDPGEGGVAYIEIPLEN